MKTLDQIIEIISVTEVRMKSKNIVSYEMNIIIRSVRKSKKLMKKCKYFDCEKVSHIVKQCNKCKKTHKSQKSDKKSDENNKRRSVRKSTIKWKWRRSSSRNENKNTSDSETAYLMKEADQDNIEFTFYAAENETSNKAVFMWKLISIE